MAIPSSPNVPHIIVLYDENDNWGRKAHEEFRQYVEAPLRELRNFTIWAVTELTGGAKTEDIVNENTQSADIVVCLVTPSFLNSSRYKLIIHNLWKRAKADDDELSIYAIIVDALPKQLPDWLKHSKTVPDGSPLRTKNQRTSFWTQTVVDDLQLMIAEKTPAPRTIHMLTSVKGGVGKTLLALGLVNHYLQKNRDVIAVDTNTTNPDFFEFLNTNQQPSPKTYGDSTNKWIYGNITRTKNFVMRKADPARLFQGCEDFWDQLQAIINDQTFGAGDIVVDTNLMIGNTIYSDQCLDLLTSLVGNRTGVNVNIWIIWTFSALKAHDAIGDALRLIEQTLSQSVRIIHVLNPSAFLPAQLNPERARLETKYRERIDYIDAMEADISEKFRDIVSKEARERQAALQQKLLDDASKARRAQQDQIPAFNDHEYFGLAQILKQPLLRDCTADELFSITDYLVQEVEKINKAQFDNPERFEQLFNELNDNHFSGGRHRNIFPIADHVAALHGYTDQLTARPKSQERLQQLIGPIEHAIQEFLKGYGLA